jgi:hypothetical protein
MLRRMNSSKLPASPASLSSSSSLASIHLTKSYDCDMFLACVALSLVIHICEPMLSHLTNGPLPQSSELMKFLKVSHDVPCSLLSVYFCMTSAVGVGVALLDDDDERSNKHPAQEDIVCVTHF